MKMVRFDPFRELEEMSARLSQIVGRSMGDGTEMSGFAEWSPAVDVEETPEEYLVKADLPDVQKADVKVGIADGILTLEGERRHEKDEKTRKFHRVERAYGRFIRRMSVPTDVDSGKVGAEFKNGVLQVHLPKSPAAKAKTIQVAVA